MRTLPLGSRVAVWEERGDVIVAVRAVKVLAAASYSSAVLRSEELLLKPPVRSTWPFGSRVAVCSSRAVVIVAVRAVNVFVVRSYRSAVLFVVPMPATRTSPPIKRTWPLGSRVAVCPARGNFIAGGNDGLGVTITLAAVVTFTWSLVPRVKVSATACTDSGSPVVVILPLNLGSPDPVDLKA